jgi:hypothetical protein
MTHSEAFIGGSEVILELYDLLGVLMLAEQSHETRLIGPLLLEGGNLF